MLQWLQHVEVGQQEQEKQLGEQRQQLQDVRLVASSCTSRSPFSGEGQRPLAAWQ